MLTLAGANLNLAAQIKVKGTVYDRTTVFPLPYVSVLKNSGRGTATDSSGNYEIELLENDSIWFSYLEKPTKKFGVSEIDDPFHFNIAILAEISILPEVRIEPVNYRMDSLQDRIDYAKGFNYKKPDFKSIVPVIGLTIIVDIDELIRALQYKKKHRALDFQRRLLQQERDKFIDHRFSKFLITKITGLAGAERDSFMVYHRPGYEFTRTASDYDFNSYIKESFRKFKERHAVINENSLLNQKKDKLL